MPEHNTRGLIHMAEATVRVRLQICFKYISVSDVSWQSTAANVSGCLQAPFKHLSASSVVAAMTVHISATTNQSITQRDLLVCR